jgi:hypothetical protein
MGMPKTNRVAWGLAAILTGIALVAGSAEARKLYPVDEGPLNPSFLAFRHRLIAAVKRHDLRFINSILNPHLISTFGDAPNTPATFKQIYEGKDAECDLWKELLAVLSLGGQFTGKHEFCAPYVYTRPWPDALNDIDHEAIIGKHIRVRIRPNEAAAVLDTLSYDLVKVDQKGSVPPNSVNPTWVKISTPSGRRGYVAGQSIRSPIDYRACFRKRRGRWWLTVFIAGD